MQYYIGSPCDWVGFLLKFHPCLSFVYVIIRFCLRFFIDLKSDFVFLCKYQPDIFCKFEYLKCKTFFPLFCLSHFTGFSYHLLSVNGMSQRQHVVPSEILRYFLCSGSLFQDRSFESLKFFGREDCKCSSPRAVANSHAAG